MNAGTAAGAVMMTELCVTFIVARPVMAGVIVIVCISPAVRLRACQDIVQVWLFENAAYPIPLLRKRCRQINIVAEARLVKRVSV